MTLRTGIFIAALAAIGLCFAPQVPAAKAAKAATAAKTEKPAGQNGENKFNLKPGARQKVCLTCHPLFEDLMKKPFVHTPLKNPGCIACHSPHASNFPKQLSAAAGSICLTCHPGILPKNARSTHKAALDGKCVQCHDQHASDNKHNLRKAGNELCYDCHKDKAETIRNAKFKHVPVEKGCVNCHSPHASPNAAALLKSEAPELCKGCHDTNKPFFIKQHSNMPVANSKCTQCHNAHGSNKAGLIYDTVHKPFASKMCNQCHEGATSPKPLALKKKGFELCRGCHSNVVNDMFAKNRLHWPVVGKDGCLNCHNPHASAQQGLLKAAPVQLCGTCHADTIQRQEKSTTKHPPIKEGMCTACHAPHASDNVFLAVNASTVELCGSCHDYMKHSTHPIGEKIIDKRNKNLIVQCLSCHRSHGTEFKKMIPFGTVSELCTQCHIQYQR